MLFYLGFMQRFGKIFKYIQINSTKCCKRQCMIMVMNWPGASTFMICFVLFLCYVCASLYFYSFQARVHPCPVIGILLGLCSPDFTSALISSPLYILLCLCLCSHCRQQAFISVQLDIGHNCTLVGRKDEGSDSASTDTSIQK